VIATALKKERASAESLDAAVAAMARLNKDAAEALVELDAAPRPIHAVTDITGFGLLGHAKEMAAGSGVSLEIDHAAVEYLPGAADAARGGHLAGGLANNREWLAGCVEFAGGVAEEYRALLFDPQTSGGLLAAIAPDAAEAAMAALAKRGVAVRRIGQVVAKRAPLIQVK